MFKLFSKSVDTDFVLSLVERLTKELPPALMVEHHKVLSVNKITRLLERNAAQAVNYQKERKFGYFRRVRLINSYKWSLKEVGYPDDFVDIAVESLIVGLAKKA